MGMEQKIILWLQSLSNSVLDVFFKIVSHAFSWVGAIVIFVAILIFINKKFALVYGVGFLFTICINFVIKTIINRPRPFEVNSDIINKLTTIGKSFPSGHMVSVTFIVMSLLALIHILKQKHNNGLFSKKWFNVLYYVFCCFCIILVAISRMYLGQHYVTDIIGGIVVSVLGFTITSIVYKKLEKNKL